MSRSVASAGVGLALLLAAPAAAQQMPRAVPEEVGLSSARLARLSAVMQEYVDAGRVAGTVTLIARHGRIAHLEATGHRDREAGAAMTTDTIFRIASQTKAITSVAAMILVEEGKLRLRDPVGKFLPEFMETRVAVADEEGGYTEVAAERPINVRDLLTHTSGISYGTGPATDRFREDDVFFWYFADKDEPVRESMRRLAALPHDAQPGSAYLYGFSTDLLGAVVEAASGSDLDTFFHERILDPLGMTDTHFFLPADKRDRLAAVYGAGADGIERGPADGMLGQGAYVDGPRRNFSGGAGLLSTITDYARFLQMMLDGGALEGARVLGPKTVELMTANHTGELFRAPGAGFGLGFQITSDLGATGGHGSVGAYGWGGAYYTTYWVDPEEDLVALFMTQLIPAGGLDLQDKFRALVYQSLVR